MYQNVRPGGEIGRHRGFKIPRPQSVPVRVRPWAPCYGDIKRLMQFDMKMTSLMASFFMLKISLYTTKTDNSLRMRHNISFLTTNLMTHLNELQSILNKSLKWHKARAKCFVFIMLALILKQTCNLASASKSMLHKGLASSFYRRMQRFFAQHHFDYHQIAQLIFQLFAFDQVKLTLDRTNWKWGKRDINILMLAVVYRGIAVPILCTLLNKRGNSDTKERCALIHRFISIFGKDRIENLFADREFVGKQWFRWLIQQEINFCIRVKKTLSLPII